jgi:hypothetical protein
MVSAAPPRVSNHEMFILHILRDASLRDAPQDEVLRLSRAIKSLPSRSMAGSLIHAAARRER